MVRTFNICTLFFLHLAFWLTILSTSLVQNHVGLVAATGSSSSSSSSSSDDESGAESTVTLGETGKPVDLEYQAQLRDMQSKITAIDDWEYVVLRLDGATGLEAADWFSGADVWVNVQALTDVEPDVEFWNDEKLSNFAFSVQPNSDNPQWPILGVVAFQQGSASQLQITLSDKQTIGDDKILLDGMLDLSLAEHDAWVDFSWFADGGYKLNLAAYHSITPLFTSQDHTNMGLTETILTNQDGSKASLVHKITAGNTKAVLYLAGRADSFAHPHVLQMYESLGYDFYSLDPRYCGRSRRFMADTQYGHWIDDFNTYREEMDYTLNYIASQAAYRGGIMVHTHSTGALLALNYAMQKQEQGAAEPFGGGYILNGPFLDWGHVGGPMNELLLENAGLVEWLMENPRRGSGLSRFHTRIWILYRYDTERRPIIQAHLNSEWAQAATAVQRKITARNADDNPIVTSAPVLLLSSTGDNTLLHTESTARMPHIATTYSSKLMNHNSHDVTYSFTKQLNDDAIAVVTEWLNDPTSFAVVPQQEEGGLLGVLRKWFGSLFGFGR